MVTQWGIPPSYGEEDLWGDRCVIIRDVKGCYPHDGEYIGGHQDTQHHVTGSVIMRGISGDNIYDDGEI